MPNDTDIANLPWLRAMEVDEGTFASMAWWLTGGATLLLWTAVALLLTA